MLPYLLLLLMTTLGAAALLAIGLLPAAWLQRRVNLPAAFFPMLLLTAVASLGWLAFWVFYANPLAGKALTILLLTLAPVVTTSAVRRDALGIRTLLRSKDAVAPLVATFALTVLHLSLFVAKAAPFLAAQGFDALAQQHLVSWMLPPDNWIPVEFAHGLLTGRVPRPLVADWVSGDRPPLQTGLLLLVWPLAQTFTLKVGFGSMSVLLQATFLLGLWTLLRALRTPAASLVLVLAVVPFTGFVHLNTIFTWPKLLAASFGLGAVALWVAGLDTRVKGALIGVWVALGLLAHGGVLFTFLPFALFGLVVARLRPRPGVMVAALVAFAATYAPWTYYQRAIDGPGDRLVKYHFAGIEEPTDEPASTAILRAYRTTPLAVLTRFKLSSLRFPLGPGAYGESFVDAVVGRHRDDLRRYEFFHVVPALGVSLAGLGWMLFKRRRGSPDVRLVGLLAGASLVVWWLLLFGPPSGTCVHHGSYATFLMLFVWLLRAFDDAPPPVVVAVASLNFLWFVTLWWRIAPSYAYLTSPTPIVASLVATVSLVAYLTVLAREGRRLNARTGASETRAARYDARGTFGAWESRRASSTM